jgi:hypothetical protein
VPRELQPLSRFGISEEALGSTAFGSALYPSDSPMTVAALAALVHPLQRVDVSLTPPPPPPPSSAAPASPPPSSPAPRQRIDNPLEAVRPAPTPQRVDVSETEAGARLHPRRLLLLPAAVLTLAAAAVVCAVALVVGAVPSATAPAAASIASAPTQTEAQPTVAEQLATVAARVRAGEQLSRNPALILGDSAAPLVAAGRVDARLLLILGQSLAVAPTRVADFPAGSDDAAGVRHRMLLSSYQGLALTRNVSSAPTPEAVAAATAWLARLTGAFAPTDIELTDAGLLVVLDPDEPAGLLPAFTAAERAAS